MDQIRIRERNKIYNEIKSVEKRMTLEQETIDRLRHQDKTDFNVKKVNDLKENKFVLEDKLSELKNRLVDLNDGLLDEELQSELDTTNSKHQKLYEKSVENKKRKSDEKKEKSTISKDYYNKIRQNRRDNINENRLVNNFQLKFFNIVDTIPDYIVEKLKNMPNNKGYIWRGVRFYGHLPSENDEEELLFEKINNKLYIHKITKDHHNIMMKENKKSNSKLVESYERNKHFRKYIF